MTDQQIAQEITNGNTAVAEQFVRGTYPQIFRLLLRLTQAREDAEDLTQQTFVVARRKIGSFRGNSSLQTWLHRIAFNEYQQWKRKRRWRTLFDGSEPHIEPGFQAFEAGHVLTEALKTVSEKNRVAFLLFEVEQLSMAEVAEVLRIPVGTAKARVSYARQQLRTLLSEEPIEVKKDEIPRPTH